jgi:cytoplasmic iron level regulating protein YaaA (DUF328/UPF0246 family)
MLILLSPAKTLDYQTPVPRAVLRRATDPAFPAQAAALIDVLRRRTPAEVATLMKLSDKLAALNTARYDAWQPEPTPENSKPAVLAFAGDVYEGLDAGTLRTADLAWAQEHLVILSGLYGVLRPLDRLQPYRLEMGTALRTPLGANLYAYWGDTVVQYLHERLQSQRGRVVVNLASQEYAKVALRPSLQARVVECRFEEGREGRFEVISFFAKRARGAMARWAIEHRVRRVEALQGFDRDGYAFAADASTKDHWVFRRTIAA